MRLFLDALLHDVVVHDEATTYVLDHRLGDPEAMLEVGRNGRSVVLVDRQHEAPAPLSPGPVQGARDQQASVTSPLVTSAYVELVELHRPVTGQQERGETAEL